mgnify:FL=1
MNTIACRGCGAPIVFLKKTRKDGTDGVHPTDAATVTPGDVRFDGVKHVSHFDTCPDAWKFRKAPAATAAAAPVAKKPAPPPAPAEPQQLGLFGATR